MAQHPSYSLIHQVEDRLVKELGRVLRLRIPLLCEHLEAMGERQTRPADRQALFSASAMLRVRLASAATMPELMAARKARSTRASLIQDAERRAIVLLDEDDLETQILAQDMAGAIISEAGTGYPSYLHLLSHVAPASWREEEINPLAAKSIAAILIEAVRTPSDSGLVKSALRSHTVKLFAPDVAQVIHGLNQQMMEAGVAPSVSARLSAGATPSAARPDLIESAANVVALEGNRPAVPASAAGLADVAAASGSAMPQDSSPPNRPVAAAPAVGEGERQPLPADPSALDVSREVYAADWLGRSAFAKTSEGPRLAMAPVLQPVVEIERDAVAFAHSLGFMPYSRQARGAYFSRNRERLEKAKATPGQLATVDVVASMFDYVVDETRLPETVKPLFWRLQQPALALCLLDPSYLSEEKRSLRHLVENFGAIATAFSGEITRGSELHRRLETVVRAVEIVTSSLQSRSAVMAQQVEKEYLKASRSVSQLVEKVARERSSLESTPQRRNRRDYAARPSKERERAVTESITRSLEERFARFDVPQSVKEFLTTVWVRQLRTAALRDGEDSAEYKVAMQVVDDLLWSLNGDRRQHSRKELAQRIPPLIRLLTDGVKRVGAKEEEQKAFFDELFLVHLRKMSKRGKGKDTVDPAQVRFPQELVDKVGRPTGSPRSEPRAQNLAGLDTALATVPQLDQALDTLPPGRRVPGTLREVEALQRQGRSLDESLSPLSIPSFTPTMRGPRTLSPDHGDASARQRETLERDLVAPTHLRVVHPRDTVDYDSRPPAHGITPRLDTKAEASGINTALSPISRLVPPVVPAPPMAMPPAGKPAEAGPAPARASEPAAPAAAAGQAQATPAGAADKVLTEDDSAQLFEVMNAVDLSDCPPEQSVMDLAPQSAMDLIDKGSWLRLTSRDGELSMYKVAWLNGARSLALLVRFPDRRALSLRFDDLLKRLHEGHAAVMHMPEL